MVQGNCVIDPVAEKRHVDARAPGDLDDPGLLIGTDTGEDHGRGDRIGELRVVHGFERRASEDDAGVDADLRAHCRRDRTVVARDDLDLDSKVAQPGDCRACVGLGAIDKCQEPDEIQIALVRPSQMIHRGRSRRHRHHPSPLMKQSIEGGDGRGRRCRALRQDRLGGTLGHQDPAVWSVDQHRGKLAIVIERQAGDPGVGRGLLRKKARVAASLVLPERLVERIPSDRSIVPPYRLVADQPEDQRGV